MPGMYGATASPTSRHASIRSPSTPRSRSPAASSPAFQALARSHGFSASTSLLAPPTNSQSSASASCRQAGLEPLADTGAASGATAGAIRDRRDRAPSAGPAVRGPLAVEVAVRHRDGPVDEVPEVVGEVGVVATDERVPATPRRRDRTAPRAGPRSGRHRGRTPPRSRSGRGSCRGSCSSARHRPRGASRGPRRAAAPRARRSTASPARRSCGTGRCPCRSRGGRPATSGRRPSCRPGSRRPVM